VTEHLATLHEAITEYLAASPNRPPNEDVPVAVELRGGGPVSELSQAGVAVTSGAAVAVGV
jgi:hypothetical protein